jgi:hypothetical protein
MKKLCKKCNTTKDVINFHKNKSTKDGLSIWCKDCNINYEHSQDRTEYKKEYNIKSYGITLEKYNLMLIAQNNRCIGCNRVFNNDKRFTKPNIDHDHITNKVRGLLCGKCNTILGYADDNITVLYNLIKYLEKHDGNSNFIKIDSIIT